MNRFIQYYADNGQSSSYYKYIDYALLPLSTALEFVLPNDQLHRRIQSFKIWCDFRSKNNLTTDESAAIFLYTDDLYYPALHNALNQALRLGSEAALEPWFAYLKLFHTALEKLPTTTGTIWRGMRIELARKMRENEDIVLRCVNSCSSSINIIKYHSNHDTALCSIKAINGRRISDYVRYKNEDEILLLPGTRLCVKAAGYDTSVMRYVVHLVEISDSNVMSSSIKPSEHDSKLVDSSKTFVSTEVITVHNHVFHKPMKDIDYSVTTFSDGNRYEVTYKRGEKNGFATLYEINGDVVIDDVARTRANGHGVRIFSNGDRYEGKFSLGNMCEYGTYHRADGYKYVGNWINDEPYGEGFSTWPNGDHYEGHHVKGKIEGYGIFTSSKEDKYEGNLVDGKAHGKGIRTWPNGDRYKGNFKDDKKHGIGTYRYANGSEYRGNWANDEIHGEGILKWSSGSQYSGTFKNGKRHGRGTLTFANGIVQGGLWDNDKYICST